ncbi:MAG: type II secretion system protein [Peptococcaceae bacterium]|nr:type II secretion system protein [Peptococcaceae bacterium]
MVRREGGFSLVEVLAAIAIFGLVLNLAAQTMLWHERTAVREYQQLETQQALRVAAMLLEREVRLAKAVAIDTSGVLTVTTPNNKQVKYYVADKDYNGIKDLYAETNGIPSPVASYIDTAQFIALRQNVWQINLKATDGEVSDAWKLIVQTRVDP